jgi:hypothetical protein
MIGPVPDSTKLCTCWMCPPPDLRPMTGSDEKGKFTHYTSDGGNNFICGLPFLSAGGKGGINGNYVSYMKYKASCEDCMRIAETISDKRTLHHGWGC